MVVVTWCSGGGGDVVMVTLCGSGGDMVTEIVMQMVVMMMAVKVYTLVMDTLELFSSCSTFSLIFSNRSYERQKLNHTH